VRMPVAVDAEYCHDAGRFTLASAHESAVARSAPATPPSNGRIQRLPLRYCRVR